MTQAETQTTSAAVTTKPEKPGRNDAHVKELIEFARARQGEYWNLLTHQGLGEPETGGHTLRCAWSAASRSAWVCTCGLDQSLVSQARGQAIWIKHEITKVEGGHSARELWLLTASGWFMHADFKKDWVLSTTGKPYTLPDEARRLKEHRLPKRQKMTFINDDDDRGEQELEQT